MKNIKRKIHSLVRKTQIFYYRIFNYKKLTNRDVSIISNNCWGGVFYNLHKAKFNSPTIDLFFMAEDYIKFVKNLKYYMSLQMKFVSLQDSKHHKHLENRKYGFTFPIGVLDDIEIMFMHYKTEKEVVESWERRKKRINYDNIIFKFNDQNLCEDKHLLEFDKLPLENKIIFTVRRHLLLENAIYLKDNFKLNYVEFDYEPLVKKGEINIINLINNIKSN